jgi:hypothetical protein
VRAGTVGGTGGFASGNLCEGCVLAGEWEDAESIANAELERARKVGGLYYEPFFRFVLGQLGFGRSGLADKAAGVALQIDAGRFAEAAATLREIGAPQLEAEVLVLAARRGTGTPLGRARELLRGLGADARLRELDADATGVSSRSGGS